ncbi:MAG: hypothetical protein SFX73_34860 [Kofleriaceae bacterium]|nr:hypothetical protein [Kofleriaceae bacterium]
MRGRRVAAHRVRLVCNSALTAVQPHQLTIDANIFVGYAEIGDFIFDDAAGDWYKIVDSNADKCPINGRVKDSEDAGGVAIQLGRAQMPGVATMRAQSMRASE